MMSDTLQKRSEDLPIIPSEASDAGEGGETNGKEVQEPPMDDGGHFEEMFGTGGDNEKNKMNDYQYKQNLLDQIKKNQNESI